MFSKKYIILHLILLFLLARLYLLFAGLENLFPHNPCTNELHCGTTVKMYMDGSINSLFDYQLTDYLGRHTVESLVAIPFFYVFGPYLFSLKLVALTFLLATMVLWFLFVKRHINTGTAVFTTLLFIFAPPSFTTYNLVVGFHSAALFFDILAIMFFFEMIRNNPSPLLVQSSSIEPNISVQATSLNQPKVWWYVLFGIVSGFALWVDIVSAITLITCMMFWFIHDKIFFLKKTFAIFVISFLIGFSFWFYYIYIHHFQTIDIFWYSSIQSKPIFHKKFWETLSYKLPYSLCFKDSLFSSVFLNYLYYAIFAIAFWGLAWFQRKPLLKMLSSFLPARWRVVVGAQCEQIITGESFFLGYIVIFILSFSLSHFDAGLMPHWYDYRRFTPLYPFIFVTIAIGLNKLLNAHSERSEPLGRTPFKLISCIFIFILISAGIMGLASQTSVRDFGKGLTFKGYSYKVLSNIFWFHYKEIDYYYKEIQKTANQIDDGLYRNHLYKLYGLKLAYLDKLEPSACEPLICDVEKIFRPACYEGVGWGYAGRNGSNASIMLEKLKTGNLANKNYEKYLLYGIATSLPIQENVDKHISIISQIDSKFQPYFYQGLGIQLAERIALANVNRILLQIDKVNRKYCCIGIGQNFAQRLEWSFADKKYYIGFDGLNKDYWSDCYYGLGWGIGDFFEFDMDRYLAVINNNVSLEHKEYCLKGLADRLCWRFGEDDTKFKKN